MQQKGQSTKPFTSPGTQSGDYSRLFDGNAPIPSPPSVLAALTSSQSNQGMFSSPNPQTSLFSQISPINAEVTDSPFSLKSTRLGGGGKDAGKPIPARKVPDPTATTKAKLLAVGKQPIPRSRSAEPKPMPPPVPGKAKSRSGQSSTGRSGPSGDPAASQGGVSSRNDGSNGRRTRDTDASNVTRVTSASSMNAGGSTSQGHSASQSRTTTTRRREFPKLSIMSSDLGESKQELQRLQALIDDTSRMLDGLKAQVAQKTEEERALHAQAAALTEMAKALLLHVQNVTTTTALHPDGSGSVPDITALREQVAFATEALGKLSEEVAQRYGDGDATDSVASAVEQGIPASGGIQSFISSKIKSILSTTPVKPVSVVPEGNVPSNVKPAPRTPTVLQPSEYVKLHGERIGQTPPASVPTSSLVTASSGESDRKLANSRVLVSSALPGKSGQGAPQQSQQQPQPQQQQQKRQPPGVTATPIGGSSSVVNGSGVWDRVVDDAAEEKEKESGQIVIAPPKRPPPALPLQLRMQSERLEALNRPETPPHTPPPHALVVPSNLRPGQVPTLRGMLTAVTGDGRSGATPDGPHTPQFSPPQPPQQQQQQQQQQQYEDSTDEDEPVQPVSPGKSLGSGGVWKEIASSRKGVVASNSTPNTNPYLRSRPISKPGNVPSLCQECTAVAPTRRCHECSDYFCDNCFQLIHRRGARQAHLWSLIDPSTAPARVSLKKELGLTGKGRSSSAEPLDRPNRQLASESSKIATFRKALARQPTATAPSTSTSTTTTDATSTSTARTGSQPPVSQDKPVTNSGLLMMSGNADWSGALSELEFKANPGLMIRQRKKATSGNEALSPPIPTQVSSGSSGGGSRALVRPVVTKIDTGVLGSQLSPSGTSSGGDMESRATDTGVTVDGSGRIRFNLVDAQATKSALSSHFQLSPKGDLVVRSGRQSKEDTLEVMKETAAISAANTLESKIRKRAVMLRQQNAAQKHVARTTDWATADAITSEMQATLFRHKLV